ncbi:hypothetical protein [Sulfuricurvum sp.]|uniref:hypothetical protein n=1 Tax=Sulfuricurvum sp. TaxID=2025608 RepID=UPI003BB0BB78
MIEILDFPLLDSDVYYVGHKLNDDNEELGWSWSIDGIFTSLDEAVKNTANDHFIVRFPINIILPDQLTHPKQSWWMIKGELLQSEIFMEA